MGYCLNIGCGAPHNPADAKFCQSCGEKLLVGDRYRALKLIGRGGFGRTFLAADEQEPARPFCVIKQLFPQAQNSQQMDKAIALFEREAQRLDELTHPQIPRLLAHFQQGQSQYLIQTYIDGQTLAWELAQEGAFSEAKVRQILQDLLPVLQYIHDRHIIHRDIKPENILRRRSTEGKTDRSGQLVLVDFGAAKVATPTSLGKTGTLIGSAGYAAPEQVGGKATFASDLYSLGVTCAHMLTNMSPFDLYSFSDGKWVWRDYLPSPVSRELAAVLDRLMEPAVSRRYVSAAAVLRDLAIPAPSAIVPAPMPIGEWQCVHTLEGHTNSVAAIAISPNGKRIASGSFDKTIRLWNANTGALLAKLTGHREPVLSLAFTPNGQQLVSASVDDTIRLWCVYTETLIYSLQDHTDSVVNRSIAVTPDGQSIVSGSDDRTIKLWHLRTGKLFQTLREACVVTSIAISPDGQRLASGGSDNLIKLWNLSTGELEQTLKGHERDVNTVAFRPDGQQLVSGSSDGTVRLWNLPAASSLTLSGHFDWVKAVAFSPSGSLVASGSGDRTVKLWDAETGKLLHTLSGHLKAVNAIAFAPDDRTLVSGSGDRTVKIWQGRESA